LGISAVAFTAMYLLLMSVFRMDEINLMLNLVKDRFKFKSQAQPS
jgi:hypothetical protein